MRQEKVSGRAQRHQVTKKGKGNSIVLQLDFQRNDRWIEFTSSIYLLILVLRRWASIKSRCFPNSVQINNFSWYSIMCLSLLQGTLFRIVQVSVNARQCNIILHDSLSRHLVPL